MRAERRKKGRNHQGFTPGRLQNGCFVHSRDLYYVYLLFAEMTINRGGWQAADFGWLLNFGLFELVLSCWVYMMLVGHSRCDTSIDERCKGQ